MASIINKTFYVDMWNPNYIKTIALQREALGRELRFYITSDSIPVNLTGITVLIYAKKPDNTSIYATCTKITESSGYCSITMDSQFMAVKGNVQCWLKLVSGTGNAISPTFNIEVLETPDIDSLVESQNEFSVFQSLTSQISDISLSSPVGEIKMWATSIAPIKHLICNGELISRITYSDLFFVLGTTYGVGDGSTTFALPNFKGRIPVGLDTSQTEFNTLGKTGGEKSHIITTQEMAYHNHDAIKDLILGQTLATHYSGTTGGYAGVEPNTGNIGYQLATSYSGGGLAHNNLQPYVSINYIIRALI